MESVARKGILVKINRISNEIVDTVNQNITINSVDGKDTCAGKSNRLVISTIANYDLVQS